MGIGTQLVQGILQSTENEGCLPGLDSNHDNLKQHGICNLQSLQWSKMPHWTRKTSTRTQLVHGHSRRTGLTPEDKSIQNGYVT